MRLKRSSSEDTSLKAVQPRSLTPPLNQILEKTKSAANSVSSSSEGRRSTTEDDSESSSERIFNSFYASWNKSHNKGSDASEKSRDSRRRSRLRDEHGYRSALRSTVIRVGSPRRRSRSKSMASNDSSPAAVSTTNTGPIAKPKRVPVPLVTLRIHGRWSRRRRLATTEEANNQVEIYRYKHEISVGSHDPRPIPKPVTTFRAAGFNEKLIKELEQQDFEESLPVQAQVVILVATREAAVQVQNCELVIATPGRLLDILTESDSDTDWSLSRRAKMIIASTLWSRGQERMARRFLGDYTLVRVGYTGNASYKLKTRQLKTVEILKEEEKLDQLKKELTDIYDGGKKPGKVVVYAERKKFFDELVAFTQDYLPCEGVHGGRTQVERDGIIQEFREVPTTSSWPRITRSIDGYVQRLARTGFSLSDACEVITFFTNENEKNSQTLVKILEESNQFVDPRLKEWARFNRFNPLDPPGKRGSSGRKRGGRGSKARRNRVRQRHRHKR
ncbi:putative ATP-dependent RNA helicase CG14443 [Drosophila bipectinata]|uniref:putative ATP-dependent RNA helicase CG14443 n=1 Tax=Drosophila bipectinata TaxID=42026 RepID=UPI0038B403C8